MPKRNISSDKRNVPQNADNPPAGSIAHAADVLLCLSNSIHTITDISRQCNLGKSTVHRVLKLLQQSQLVVQNASDRRYYLGPFIVQLASNPASTHEYLIMYAADEMKRLSALSEETVTLDILIGTQIFYLYEIPSIHDLKVTQNNRITEPLHSGASSMILLSQLGDKQLKIALDNIHISPESTGGSGTKGSLMNRLKEIRLQGYAISTSKRISGAMCVSVPIKNYVLPAVLSVVGPESRLRPGLETVIEVLKVSSIRISDKIAKNGARPFPYTT
jgi:IclR family KDG regulon transcriptional repressor